MNINDSIITQLAFSRYLVMIRLGGMLDDIVAGKAPLALWDVEIDESTRQVKRLFGLFLQYHINSNFK